MSEDERQLVTTREESASVPGQQQIVEGMPDWDLLPPTVLLRRIRASS